MPSRSVHIVGAGPVGLLLTALLQPVEEFSVRLYEKRSEYSRTRMVRLAGYLVADSVDAYRADHFDGENVDAVFEPEELAEGLAFRQSIPADLMALLRRFAQGFVPLNAIEQSVSDLIDGRDSHPVQRTVGELTAQDAIAMVEPGDVLIDCTGTNSLLRDHLAPGDGDGDPGANTLNFLFEHALVITFLYSQTYACNEFCKYYKNVENPHYKFIPMVHRVSHDGSVSHVTGIVTITADEFEAMLTSVVCTSRVSMARFCPNLLRRARVAPRSHAPRARSAVAHVDDARFQRPPGEAVADQHVARRPSRSAARGQSSTPRVWPAMSRSSKPAMAIARGIARPRRWHSNTAPAASASASSSARVAATANCAMAAAPARGPAPSRRSGADRRGAWPRRTRPPAGAPVARTVVIADGRRSRSAHRNDRAACA